MTQLKRGTQIAYIPTRANGDIAHKDVEFGFVTSGPTADGSYFCRYYYKNGELRTKANSECTHFNDLRVCDSRLQSRVEEDLLKYC